MIVITGTPEFCEYFLTEEKKKLYSIFDEHLNDSRHTTISEDNFLVIDFPIHQNKALEFAEMLNSKYNVVFTLDFCLIDALRVFQLRVRYFI